MTSRSMISAFIVCLNEEANIRRCLESVKWCDEIVVIDSGSKDQTLPICREYTRNVIERGWPGFVEQKRYGLSQCSSEWVLNMDADEEVSPELRDEIISMLKRDKLGAVKENGFYLSRVVFYLQKWWRKGGWYPEYRLRVCRRSKTSWGGDDPHEKAIVTGATERLIGELRHFTYLDLSQHIRSMNSHSSAAARTMFSKGVKSSSIQLFLRPPLRFLKFYIIKKGWMEGFPGLLVAGIEAWYVFLKYAKLWELWKNKERRS